MQDGLDLLFTEDRRLILLNKECIHIHATCYGFVYEYYKLYGVYSTPQRPLDYKS